MREIEVTSWLDGHVLSADTYQFMLKHPTDCKNRGSSSDKGRTYHGYWIIEGELSDCGLNAQCSLLGALKRISEGIKESNKRR